MIFKTSNFLVISTLYTAVHAASSAAPFPLTLSPDTGLCYEAKLTPYLSSRTKVSETGSGTSTIIIDPLSLSYTRTIVFSDLSSPSDVSQVHDEQAPLPGFPDKVQEGSYIQTFPPKTPFSAYYIKELAKENVNEYITLSKVDILHGVYLPCKESPTSPSAAHLPGKRLRGERSTEKKA